MLLQRCFCLWLLVLYFGRRETIVVCVVIYFPEHLYIRLGSVSFESCFMQLSKLGCISVRFQYVRFLGLSLCSSVPVQVLVPPSSSRKVGTSIWPGPSSLGWCVCASSLRTRFPRAQVPCGEGCRVRKFPSAQVPGSFFFEGQCVLGRRHPGIGRRKINAFQSRKKNRSLRVAPRAALSPAGPPAGNDFFCVIGKHLFFVFRFPVRTLVQPATPPKIEHFISKLQFRGGSPYLLAARARVKNGTLPWWVASACR